MFLLDIVNPIVDAAKLAVPVIAIAVVVLVVILVFKNRKK